MNRQSRMIGILLVFAVIGIVVLALVAKRYQGFRELKSVHDLPATETAMQDPAGERSSDLGPEAKLKAFVEIRAELKEAIDSKKHISDRIIADWDGKQVVDDFTARTLLVHIMMIRKAGLQEAGMSEKEYLFLRDQYRAWRSGEGELLPEWRELFDSHGQMLEGADLGRYERMSLDIL